MVAVATKLSIVNLDHWSECLTEARYGKNNSIDTAACNLEATKQTVLDMTTLAAIHIPVRLHMSD